MKLKVNARGYLTATFSTDIRAYHIDYYNSTILDLYIEPTEKKGFYDRTGNMTDLNFTWKAVSFYKNKLEIKLNFTKPSSISPFIN